jgi:hypothetical protein
MSLEVLSTLERVQVPGTSTSTLSRERGYSSSLGYCTSTLVKIFCHTSWREESIRKQKMAKVLQVVQVQVLVQVLPYSTFVGLRSTYKYKYLEYLYLVVVLRTCSTYVELIL